MEYRYDKTNSGRIPGNTNGKPASIEDSGDGRFFVRVGRGGRLIAAGFSLLLLVPIVVIFAGSAGYVDLKYIFTPCGFKQHTGLPCPGCGVTTAIQALVRGDLASAFYIQPAGAVLGISGVIVGVFALLVAVFGVNSSFLQRLKFSTVFKYGVLAILTILACGWAVTLSRALSQ